MKRRVTAVLNFFAINLLFFALYLNFVHKDKDVLESLHTNQSVSTEVPLVENGVHSTQKEGTKQNSSATEKRIAKSSLN